MRLVIVLDGIYYAAALAAGGVLAAWLAGPWFGAPLWVLAAYCLYFFRDPERAIPEGPVAVSPADGKVVAVVPEGPALQRVSVFLNIFDVHVNRAPIAGTIASVQYREGRFHVASRAACSTENEQNVVTVQGDLSVDGTTDSSVKGTVEGSVTGSTDNSVAGSTDRSVTDSAAGSTDSSVTGSTDGSTDRSVTGSTAGSTAGLVPGSAGGSTVVFKQIAGLIARRIVFRKRPGDRVSKGERVGLIKFGSRVDVLFGPEWEIAVRPGERVSAGSSVIARRLGRGAPDGA